MNLNIEFFERDAVMDFPVEDDLTDDKEEYIFVESEKAFRIALEHLNERFAQFPIHQLNLSASVCCLSDAADQIKDLTDGIPRSNPISKEYSEKGPYALAFWSQVKKSDEQFSKLLYFTDCQILASRGKMAGMEKVQLFSNELFCNSQVFVDLARWGENAYCTVERKCYSMAELMLSKLEIGVNTKRKVSLKVVALLDAIHERLQSNEMFTLFTRYFHQGPLNDMMYSILADGQKHWNATLIPDQKGMERSFHLFHDPESQAYKLTIIVKGFFTSGYISEVGMLEPNPARKLGLFHGVTVVNLKTGAASVRTFIDVDKDKWVIE